MNSRMGEVRYCLYIQSLFNKRNVCRVDFIISQNYIKFLFYCNYQYNIDTYNILENLNGGLIAFNIKCASAFYMRLRPAKYFNFDMCWEFLSFNNVAVLDNGTKRSLCS